MTRTINPDFAIALDIAVCCRRLGATEIQKAHALGVEFCKLFPGAQVGGPAFVKAMKGPCPWTKIMPTGGVSPTEESLSALAHKFGDVFAIIYAVSTNEWQICPE